MNYQWYLTKRREELKEQAKKTPDFRDFSIVLEQALEEWLKTHGAGNPTYRLDKYQESGFEPFPTPWGSFGTQELKAFSWKEDDEMIDKLKAASSTLRRDRQAKRDAEMRAKGLRA